MHGHSNKIFNFTVITTILFILFSAYASIANAQARMIADIVYGSHSKQSMDVYLPDQPSNAPIIMMVHGGAWFLGDKMRKNVVANKVNRWVARGFVLVSVNYRLAPLANPIAQARDVARALAKVQRLASGWGANPTQITLMGHSSGAHLVALLTASPNLATKQGANSWLGSILIDSAAYDIPRIMKSRHARFYDKAFGQDPDFWNAASPIAQLQSTTMPILAICSTKRRKPCPRALAFTTKATALGSQTKLLRIAKNHKQLNQSLGLSNAYTAKVEVFLSAISPVNASLL